MSRPNSSNDNIGPSSSISDNRKQSLYFPEAMLEALYATEADVTSPAAARGDA